MANHASVDVNFLIIPWELAIPKPLDDVQKLLLEN
jgi:hypothetical protein